jgi:ACS family glucarate transporter-like MFS transporter
VQGIFFAGAHLAGGLTPLAIVALQPYLKWRAIFVLFGCVGFLWAILWFTTFRDDPTQDPAVGGAELQRILAERPTDAGLVEGWEYWRRLLRSPTMWALCVMYASNSSIFYFCITWLPTYLHERHGFDATNLGFFSGLPLLVSVPSDLFGGVVTDKLSARFGLRIGRCALGAGAYVVSAAALFVAAGSPTPVVAASLIALATASCMFTLGAAWSTCIEIGRNHVGVVGATMNTAGQLASLLCPIVVAYSVAWYGNWNLPLYLLAGLFLLGVVSWAMIDPKRLVFED